MAVPNTHMATVGVKGLVMCRLRWYAGLASANSESLVTVVSGSTVVQVVVHRVHSG